MKPLHLAGREIRGEHYRPACGRCDVPPWEACACSALLPELAPMRTHSEGIADLFNACSALLETAPGTADRINDEAQARLDIVLTD